MILASLILALPAIAAPPQEAAPDEGPKWTGSLTAGATTTSGNTDITTGIVLFDAVRAGEDDRYTLRGWWNYAEQSGTLSERNVGASLKYDYFASEKMYYLAIAGAKSDSIAKLDSRTYLGAGAGYQFRDDEEIQFLAEGALTSISESFSTGADDSYLALRLATTLGWQVSKTTRFDQILEAYPSLEESTDFTGKADHRLRTDISESFYTQLQWIYDYDNTPAAGSERADQKLVFGVGWSF